MSTLTTLGGLTIEHDPTNQAAAPDDPVEIRGPIDTMPTSSFSSSNVHSGLYDYGEMELFMRYLRDGTDAIYRYKMVPAETWEGLQGADSKGSYINRAVAYTYAYTKLSAGNFPDRGHGLDDDRARRFVTTP